MNEDIRALQRELTEGMTDYMIGDEPDDDDGDASAFDAGYSQAHIDRCNEILETFFEDMLSLPAGSDDAEILELVKNAVIELNAVNEEAEGSLIETDQRELLCEIFILSAQAAGLKSDTGDITEEWREW